MVDPLIVKILKNNKPPFNIVVDIVDTKWYVGLRVYENEVMSLSSEKQLLVMEYLHKIRKMVEEFGVKCHFQGVPGDPPRSF